MRTNNLIVAGVGGQGSIMTSHIIAEAAIASGIEGVRVGETYGAAMRGGSVVSHVRIGEAYAPLISEDEATLIIALEPLEGLRTAVKYLSSQGKVILNNTPLHPMDTNMGYATYPKLEDIVSALKKIGKGSYVIPARDLAVSLGNVKVVSTIMIGAAAASGLLNINEDVLKSTLDKRVPPHTTDINRKAFSVGYEEFTRLFLS